MITNETHNFRALAEEWAEFVGWKALLYKDACKLRNEEYTDFDTPFWCVLDPKNEFAQDDHGQELFDSKAVAEQVLTEWSKQYSFSVDALLVSMPEGWTFYIDSDAVDDSCKRRPETKFQAEVDRPLEGYENLVECGCAFADSAAHALLLACVEAARAQKAKE